MSLRQLAMLLVGIVSLAACGGRATGSVPVSGDASRAPATAEVRPGSPAQIDIVAADIAFDVDTVSVPVGDVEFRFDNRDEAVLHNLRVTGPGVDVATALESGPIQQRLEVALVEPGSYAFFCEIHPARMAGTVEAG